MTSPLPDPVPFDSAGGLPPAGITVIEASAGTGKTYALTSLVLRFVAAGVPLSSILAVTFTKMATGELRDRVRSRLAQAQRCLGQRLGHAAGAPGDDPGDDEVLAALAAGPVEAVEARWTAISDALAEFDSATIATTHGFCQMVLHGLGTAGETLPGTTLLEDPADLMDEVVDDLYLRRSLLYPKEDRPFTVAQARRAAVEATRNLGTTLVPSGGEDPAGLLSRLAARARLEVGRRLQEENLLTYDHLLFRLARTLEHPVWGPVACGRLGARYQVVLVDEFQDTDPVQWAVLRLAFGGGATRLVLIGDPKQAVYAFRGADVHAYLEAAASADAFYTLDTNWRADQPLLDATAALLAPLQFGHPGIRFRSVRAPDDRQASGIAGGGCEAPMRWRLVPDAQRGIPVTKRGLFSKPPLRDWVAGDVAGDIARLLASDASVTEAGERRPLLEKDVAVLTRTNAQALAVREELRSLGIQSVVGGLDSVFKSDAAVAWLRLFEALQEPSSRSRAAAVALGPFVGMSQLEVATAPERRWEELHERLHSWAAVLSARGVAALYRALTVEQGLPARVLAHQGGERALTDLGHLAELLHAEAAGEQLGAPSLRNWLAARIRAVAEEQAESEERSRRLDSDAEAVRVLTIHGAKGLEFPVVYCPYLWDAGPPERESPPVVFHDPESGDARTLDVGCPEQYGPARSRYQEHAAIGRAERRGEDLRLLYVALTRARHRVVIWWGRTQECRHSPLGRLLIGRDPVTGEVRESRGSEPTSKQIRAALDAVAGRAPGLLEIEDATGPGRAGRDGPEQPGEGATSDLEAARFTRSLDLRWRRASYSSITALAHGDRADTDRVGSEPEDEGTADEPAEREGQDLLVAAGGRLFTDAGAAGAESPPAGDLERPSPLAGVPGGAALGTFVHHVLEAVDFAAVDLSGAIQEAVRLCVRRDGGPGGVGPAAFGPTGAGPVDLDLLSAGLSTALASPLGPLLPGLTLAQIGRRDRIDELGFELPVAGGERPVGSVRMADIAEVLQRHHPGHGVLQGYAAALLDPLLDSALRGYLTGSLDLVFRRRRLDGGVRWYLADYKTNWLGASPDLLTVGDYRIGSLEAEMQRRHYPLQALIYMVALHRYLRWRQAGYEPEQHLGGILYLFVRGMAGPTTPEVDGSPCGVWSWAPPPALVTELSDLFESGRSGVRA